MTAWATTRGTAAALLLAPALAATATEELGNLAVTTWEVPDRQTRIGLRDMDGDGRQDLVRLDPRGIGVRFLGPGGAFPDADDALLPWPGDEVGWDLTDFDGDGAVDVLMVLESQRAVIWRLDATGSFGEGAELLAGIKGHLPRGIRHVPFAHDVDDDGRLDLVVPGSGTYRIHLALADGTFAEPVLVGFEARVDYDVGDPERLDGRFGEDIEIPWFRLFDVDGDGRTDLVSETRDIVLFHIADPELPTEPTWRLPIGELREEARDNVRIDLDDLLSNLDRIVTWRLFDLDGVYPDDLVLLQGGTFRIFLGGSLTGIDRTPDTLLKSSGNVLHYVVRDVAGDPLPELQIIRGDRISLGQAVRLLILPGAIDIDVFTYANEGGEFSKKPIKRSTISLQIPRLLSFMEEMEETKDEMKERVRLPVRRLCLDGDGVVDDVVDLRDGRLLFFRNVLPDDLEESISERLLRSPSKAGIDDLLEAYILEDLDSLDDGDSRSIDLEDLKDIEFTPWADYRSRTGEAQPVRTLTTPFKEAENVSLRILDVDGDGVSDVVIVGEIEDERLVQVVVVRPE